MAQSEKEKIDEAISKEYKKNPSIETYLDLRKSYPENDIEVAIGGGIEHAFKNQSEIEDLGISIKDYLGILDGDHECISRVCLHLLDSIAQSRKLTAAGHTHLARRHEKIPDQMIDWFICCILNSQSWNGTLELNTDLIVLIRQGLMPGMSTFEDLLAVKTQRSDAALIGGQLLAVGLVPSFRKIAKIMGVQPSTVKRWFATKDEFDRECTHFARWFDEKGKLRDLSKK